MLQNTAKYAGYVSIIRIRYSRAAFTRETTSDAGDAT